MITTVKSKEHNRHRKSDFPSPSEPSRTHRYLRCYIGIPPLLVSSEAPLADLPVDSYAYETQENFRIYRKDFLILVKASYGLSQS